MRRLLVSQKAHKQIGKLPSAIQAAVYEAIASLANWPDCRNVKALAGKSGYRLRVGDYRVLFEVEQETLQVTEVRKRDERTYH
jgi:mRNA interferase RelE/StbE